jgi:hypothetical protein
MRCTLSVPANGSAFFLVRQVWIAEQKVKAAERKAVQRDEEYAKEQAIHETK